MDKVKAWNRANNIGNAQLLEFKRYIENKALREDVHKIQAKTSLPLSLKNNEVSFFEDPIYINWMGWEETNETTKNEKHKRRRKVAKEAKRLLNKYNIPSHFFGSLHSYIVWNNQDHTYQTKGFPEYIHGPHRSYKIVDYGYGEWEPLCIIKVETDLENPLVLENIKAWQRRNKKIPPHHPPLPIKIGRKKDYRPVWEWHNRNPDVSVGELAKTLKINRVTLTRALKNLDKEYATK